MAATVAILSIELDALALHPGRASRQFNYAAMLRDLKKETAEAEARVRCQEAKNAAWNLYVLLHRASPKERRAILLAEADNRTVLLHLLRRCIKYSFFVGMDVVLDVLDLFEERTDGLPPHLRNYKRDTRGSTCEVRGWIAAMDFLQYCPRPMEPWDGVVSKRLRQVVTRRWICQAYIAKQLDFIIAEAPEELSRVSQYDLRIISRAYETRNPDGEIAPCAWVQSIIERSPRQIRKESSDSE